MDLNSFVMDDVARRPQTAFIALFVAGLFSAFGPCSAQRALGFVASTTHRKATGTSIVYASRIIAAGTIMLLSTAVLRKLAETSHYTSAVLAIFCLTVGFVGLWQAEAHRCRPTAKESDMTAAATFALGFGSTLLIAPCCTPFLLFIAAYAPSKYIVVDALAYSVGSAIPYLVSGVFMQRALASFAHASVQQALRIISSTISIALGLLYTVEI